MNLLLRLPIRFQLRLIVLIMALPMVGMIVNSGFRQRKEALGVAGRDTQKLADRIADEQRHMDALARQLMASLSQLPEIREKDPLKTTRLLRDLHKVNPDLTNIFVADRSGTVWASAVPTAPPFVISDRRYFKNALAGGRLSSGEYVVSRVTGQPTFNLSYPVKDARGEVSGVIAIGYSLGKYTRILERSKLPANSCLVLLDHRGVILFRAVDPERFIGKQSDPALFRQIREAPDEETTVGTGVSLGDKRVISSRKLRLEGEPSPYMYIRVGIPVESVFSEANSQLLKNLIVLSWVLLLALGFASFIGKRSILTRIAALEKASQNLAEGDHRVRVADLVKGGELGRLAESFDAMAGKLVQREEALQASEERFRSFVENANDIVFSVTPEGLFSYVSPNWCDAFGYRLDETVGRPFIPFVHPDDVSACLCALQRVLVEGGKLSGIEYRVLHKNGTYIWYSANGSRFCDSQTNRVCFLGIGRDISDRKQAQEALSRSEAHYRSLFDNSIIGVAVTDKGFNFIDVNDAFCTLTGYEKEELVGKMTIGRLSHPDDLDRSVAMLDRIMRGELDHYSIEKRYITKGGATITVLIYVIGVYNADGVYEGSTAAVLDISERKQVEEERLQLERQLLHAQKLESLGVLAGGIAHDFNNILTSIVGNADLALLKMNPESPAIDNLHRIETAAARAADLAKQMLAYSGKGKFVVEPIHLNLILEEMLHMLEVSISKQAVLRLNLTPHVPLVEADATQMRQIVMNLVINASEAIGSKSGVIAITTGCVDCDRAYLKDVWLDENLQPGLHVYLEIADTGCGMDQKTLEKIFDPFFTTKFTGRGLGMAAVLGIVRGHRGAIRVYSEPGRGSAFKILLPASGKPVELFNRVDGPDDWTGSGTVLLVDDEETVRGIGKEMLQELGFSVITANDGVEAVEFFGNNPDIAFVILDLTMPHMDGEQCFRELHRIRPDVKVIMSSGFNEQEVTEKFLGKGLSGFIQKPYKFSTLKEAVRRLEFNA